MFSGFVIEGFHQGGPKTEDFDLNSVSELIARSLVSFRFLVIS